MGKPSIDYLNRRRELKAASGGTNYFARDRVTPPNVERERAAGLTEFELISERLAAFYRHERMIVAEFRRQLQGGCTDEI